MVSGIRTRQVLDFIRERLSRRRFEHSLRVARTAVRMARHFGQDPGDAWLAGLLHDTARELSDEELLEYALRTGIPVTEEEQELPVLLHGKAGARIVEEALPWISPEALRGIAHHIKGGEGISDLEMIIYIADFMEPGRSYHDPGWDRWDAFIRPEDLYRWVERTSSLYYKKSTAGV